MLGVPKILNEYVVQGAALSICGTSQYPAAGGGISNDQVISQQLDISPTINNLVVPRDSMYGDSVIVHIDLHGLFPTANYVPSIQYLGCSVYDPVGLCAPHGLIRVRVNVGSGLHVPAPDSLVYFLIDTANNPTRIFASYYNTTVIPFDTCMKGSYYFYFPVTQQLLYAMNFGSFESTISSCCAKPYNDEPVKVQIAFYLMPDPSGSCNTVTFPTNHIDFPTYSNANAAYIPLSAKGLIYHIHCVGCLSPGLVADRYFMEKQNWSWQASNNNGIADSSLTYIGTDSVWLAQHEKFIKRNVSSYGDQIRDFLIAHFQDGSVQTKDTTSPGGYTYSMMKADTAFLKYFQILTIVPDNSTDYGLMPKSLDFYVDDRDNVNPHCIDCIPFKADTNFRTKLHFHVDSIHLSQFMHQNVDTFFFTFSTDSSQYYLLDTNYAVYRDTINPFSTFEIDQRYRMTVSYDECKYFSAGAVPTTETAKHVCEITVRNWLSGLPKNSNAFDIGLSAPNDTIALDVAGYTFNTAFHPGKILVSQHFADSLIFLCEFNGTMHNFYSQDLIFSTSYASTDSDCNLTLELRAESRTAGSLSGIHSFPYEYRPPSLIAKSFMAFIPPGYTVVSATLHHMVHVNPIQCNGLCATKNIYLPLPPLVNNYMLFDNLPNAVCFDESKAAGIGNDTNLYVRNDGYSRVLDILLAPDSCTSLVTVNLDTAYSCVDEQLHIPCIDFGHCSDTAIVPYLEIFHMVYESKANLHIDVSPFYKVVNKHQLIWNVEFTNTGKLVDFIDGKAFYTTVAANIFLQTPSFSFLTNWTFKNDDSATTALSYNARLIKIADYLRVNKTIKGTLTCNYAPCADSAQLIFIAGNNCDGFPTDTTQVSSVCQSTTDTVYIKDASASLTTGNISNVAFSLCDEFDYQVNFNLSNTGDVYADSLIISGLPTGMKLTGVQIKNCTTGSWITLDTTLINNHWSISQAQMYSAGFADSTMVADSIQNCITVKATFIADCSFNSGFGNNSIKLFGHKFCGDTTSADVQGFNFIYNGINHCTNCYTVTKTVDKDTAAIGDTLTYHITIQSHNGSPQQIFVQDIFPFTSDFTTISTIPVLPAYWFNFPADTTVTYIVTGYFTLIDGCPNTMNVASVMDSSLQLTTDTVCVYLTYPCATDTTIILKDGDKGSSLTSTVNQNFIITGNFIADAPTPFLNCKFYAMPDASITVPASNSLNLENTTIEGCRTMWQGISLDDGADIYMSHQSMIRDANTGITASDNQKILLNDSRIVDCVTGLNIPPSVDCSLKHNIYCEVTGMTFGLTRPAFLPDYASQPIHGQLAKAGIEANDMTAWQIGNNAVTKNTFNRLNNGLVAFRSDITLYNSTFNTIVFDTTVYKDDYTGSAIVSQGTLHDCGVNATMTIAPNTIDGLVNSSYRGIFTDYSTLYIDSNQIVKVYMGILNRKSVLQTVSITNCRIEASFRGILWRFNENAVSMTAKYDTIIMSDDTRGIGIKMLENIGANTANYWIEQNQITLYEARAGVDASVVLLPVIVGNNIKQLSNGTYYPPTNGIHLASCDKAFLSCNIISTNYPNTTARCVGINVSQSTSSTIQCDSTINHYRGVFFGGACGGTAFLGNTMKDNYEGLHLNNVAVIGTQYHYGNKWINYQSNFGAVDDYYSGEYLSLFWVHTSMGSPMSTSPQFYPGLNSSNLSATWYAIDTTQGPFNCEDAQTCIDYSHREDSYQLERAIATNVIQTPVYIAETKNINEGYLVEKIAASPTTFAGDTVYSQFYNDKINEPVGKLYDVKAALQNAEQYSQQDIYLIALTDSLIKIKSDSITLIDSLNAASAISNYDALRANLIAIINTLNATKSNIILVQQVNAGIIRDSVEIKNTAILPVELPETNSKLMNEMHLLYKDSDIEALRPYYNQILPIAQQCPYAGGTSVYQARNFVELFNDTIEYDDDAVCLQSGIYRQAQNEKSNPSANDIRIIPNPATNNFTIVLSENLNGICNLNITDIVGKLLILEKLDCKIKIKNIDTSILPNGIYFVEAKTESLTLTKKLIIVH